MPRDDVTDALTDKLDEVVDKPTRSRVLVEKAISDVVMASGQGPADYGRFKKYADKIGEAAAARILGLLSGSAGQQQVVAEGDVFQHDLERLVDHLKRYSLGDGGEDEEVVSVAIARSTATGSDVDIDRLRRERDEAVEMVRRLEKTLREAVFELDYFVVEDDASSDSITEDRLSRLQAALADAREMLGDDA